MIETSDRNKYKKEVKMKFELAKDVLVMGINDPKALKDSLEYFRQNIDSNPLSGISIQEILNESIDELKILKTSELSISSRLYGKIKLKRYENGHLLLYGIFNTVLLKVIACNNLESPKLLKIEFDKRYNNKFGKYLSFKFSFSSNCELEFDKLTQDKLVEYGVLLSKLDQNNPSLIRSKDMIKITNKNLTSSIEIVLPPFLFYSSNHLHSNLFKKALHSFSSYNREIVLDEVNKFFDMPKNSTFGYAQKSTKILSEVRFRNKEYSVSKNESSYHFNNFLFSYHDGNISEAIRYIDIAISISPNSALFHWSKSIFLSQIGEFRFSLDSMNRAIELTPVAQYVHNRAVIFINLGNFNLALQDLDKCIDLETSLSLYRFHRGLVHTLEENYELALNDYVTSLEINPSEEQLLLSIKADLIRYCLRNDITLNMDTGLIKQKLNRSHDD